MSVFNNKLNVFLDLDNTLICSEEYTKEIMEYVYSYDHDFIPPYVTVGRNFLQKFLGFLFRECNVNIWTAASKNYASFIVDRFIKQYDPNRKINLLLFNTHCELSTIHTNGLKSLSMLWDVWKIEGYNKKNTIIIDDLKEVYTIQPDNCIRIKSFKIKSGEADDELLKMIPKIEYIIKNGL